MPSLIFQQLGPLEIGLIVLAILVVFGVGKVADIGGALGRSIREFRRELREGQEEERKEEATKVEGKSEEEKKS
jgi:sec-independent protein translocase protein TatA